MASSKTIHLKVQNQLIGFNQLNESSTSNEVKLKDKYCAPIQTKDILSASKQLLDITNRNISRHRKCSTNRRPHPATCRGIWPHKSLTLNTCSSTHSPRNLTLLVYQIIHITFGTHHSSQEGRLLTDTASDGETSFHTVLQMITKQGCKSVLVKVHSGAEVNNIPLSKYKQLFAAHFTKSNNLKGKHYDQQHMLGQLGYFIADIHHKTPPDILQVRFFRTLHHLKFYCVMQLQIEWTE